MGKEIKRMIVLEDEIDENFGSLTIDQLWVKLDKSVSGRSNMQTEFVDSKSLLQAEKYAYFYIMQTRIICEIKKRMNNEGE